MTRAGSLWSSTVGKKIVMAVTGLIMVGFLIAHMAGNLQLFEGAER
ncbi:MAG: succinate dehydrogenase, partial [Gemmatimonadota bacterium]|nr:succinate dehydrogenase [Gemmatimonadota bacterium]